MTIHALRMQLGCRRIVVGLSAVGLAAFARLAEAQSRVQFDAAMAALAAGSIADGTFSAVASPWADAAHKRTDVARFTGIATAVSSGASYLVYICEATTLRHFQASFTIMAKPPAGETTPPTEAEFTIPDRTLVANVAGGAVTLGGLPSAGKLKITVVAGKSISGTAQMRYAAARLPGAATTEPLDVGITFKAPFVDGKAPASECVARDAAKTPTAPAPTSAPATTASSFAQGDVVVPKIAGARVLSDARDGATVVLTLKKSDELVSMGEERNGFVHVQGATAEGWIKKILISKR